MAEYRSDSVARSVVEHLERGRNQQGLHFRYSPVAASGLAVNFLLGIDLEAVPGVQMQREHLGFTGAVVDRLD
jgi:hypothetical protein